MKRKKVLNAVVLGTFLCLLPGFVCPEMPREQIWSGKWFWSGLAYAGEAASPAELLSVMETLAASEPAEQNSAAIRILLDQALAVLPQEAAASQMLISAGILLDKESTDWSAVTALLQEAGRLLSEETLMEPEEEDGVQADISPQASETHTEFQREDSGLPACIVDSFIWKLLAEQVSLQVPSKWGNNASDSAVTSYSPVNKSGAISPGAGTLTTTYFTVAPDSNQSAFEEYEQGIARMSVTSDFTSMDASAAGLPAKRLQYKMNIGANEFTCEAVCFHYKNTMYAVEMMQGQKSVYDYFPVFDTAVNTLHVGEEATETELPEPEQPQSEEVPETELPEPEQPSPEDVPETELPEAEQPQTEPAKAEGDLADFVYEIDGKEYSFPTEMSRLEPGAFPIDPAENLPYEFVPNSDEGGLWNELANTQYYFFDNALFKEMAGITNMSGREIPVSQGMLTALIDLEGGNVSLSLPGGISVGAPEGAVSTAFPEFEDASLDGVAGFRGNELLYASNVREDGCNGYVLIRNDAPYYSALSIICENGAIREICFECLGKDRAKGVFL